MSSGTKCRKRSISGPAASSIEPNTKRKRYFCTYQKDWESEFKWIKGSIVQTLFPELILPCSYNKKQLQTSITYKQGKRTA